mgnify:CR=1 FL=1
MTTAAVDGRGRDRGQLTKELSDKAAALDARLEALGSVLVAYSGGVDSAVLAITAARVPGERSLCIPADSPSYPDHHRDLAIGTARAFHLRHEMVPTSEVNNPEYRANPANRCYYCKHELYTQLTAIAKARGFAAGDGAMIKRAIIKLESGLSIVPASLDLAIAENELVGVYGREQIFSTMIEPGLQDYDFIFIDCPHAIGMLTVNALTASDYVLIPLPGEFLPLKGVYSFMHQYDKIRKKLNRKLELLGLVLTKYEERKTMNVQVRDELVREFGDKVCQTVIRTNIQLAKAQELGKDIFSFDKNSNGAKDYEQLAEELLKRI